MTMIKPSVQIIEERDLMKKIELAARTCYKSEDKITEGSAEKMYNRLVASGHTAMLEHATVVFSIPSRLLSSCKECKYLNVTKIPHTLGVKKYYLCSGNLRAINESGVRALVIALYHYNPALAYNITNFVSGNIDEAIKALEEKLDNEYKAEVIRLEDVDTLSLEEIKKHRYTTIKFVTDRGVSHELVRHRAFSFAQESTRYCKYNKGNMCFIRPAHWDVYDKATQNTILNCFEAAEKTYTELLDSGMTAQEARAVLPNALKTEIVVTGNEEEWTHFFNLRARGTTGAPHPDMKEVAFMAMEQYSKFYARVIETEKAEHSEKGKLFLGRTINVGDPARFAAHYINNVKIGAYNYIVHKTKDGMVANIEICHVDNEFPDTYLYTDTTSVKSGFAGIYDNKYFCSMHLGKAKDDWLNDIRAQMTGHNVCSLKKALTVVSGYGDGKYNIKYNTDKDGLVYTVLLEFIKI